MEFNLVVNHSCVVRVTSSKISIKEENSPMKKLKNSRREKTKNTLTEPAYTARFNIEQRVADIQPYSVTVECSFIRIYFPISQLFEVFLLGTLKQFLA